MVSATGTKRTSVERDRMSAFGGKADILTAPALTALALGVVRSARVRAMLGTSL